MEKHPGHPLPDYAAARDRARAARPGVTLYPRIVVLGGTWCRQDHPGAELLVLTPARIALPGPAR